MERNNNIAINNLTNAKTYIENKIKLYDEFKSITDPNKTEMQFRRENQDANNKFITKQHTVGSGSYQLNSKGDLDLFGYQYMTFQNINKIFTSLNSIQDQTTKKNIENNLLKIINQIYKNDQEYRPENAIKKIITSHDGIKPIDKEKIQKLQKTSKNSGEYIMSAYVKPLDHQIHNNIISKTHKSESLLNFEKINALNTLCTTARMMPNDQTAKNNINNFEKYIETEIQNKTKENLKSESNQKDKLASEYKQAQGFFTKLFNKIQNKISNPYNKLNNLSNKNTTLNPSDILSDTSYSPTTTRSEQSRNTLKRSQSDDALNKPNQNQSKNTFLNKLKSNKLFANAEKKKRSNERHSVDDGQHPRKM